MPCGIWPVLCSLLHLKLDCSQCPSIHSAQWAQFQHWDGSILSLCGMGKLNTAAGSVSRHLPSLHVDPGICRLVRWLSHIWLSSSICNFCHLFGGPPRDSARTNAFSPTYSSNDVHVQHSEHFLSALVKENNLVIQTTHFFFVLQIFYIWWNNCDGALELFIIQCLPTQLRLRKIKLAVNLPGKQQNCCSFAPTDHSQMSPLSRLRVFL